MRTDVVALYVDRTGPYPALVADWYDATRDARNYGGGTPVVAHPPCGPWGRIAHRCTLQDPSAALHAVDVVRRCGGVLEHPAHSRLWTAAGLPPPGGLPDVHGGITLAVQQWIWGHPAVKPTWLYVVRARRVPPLPTPDGARPEGPVTQTAAGARRKGILVRLSKRQRRLTPPAFAVWLVDLAAECEAA